MNRAPEGGLIQKLSILGGAFLGFKYGHHVGALIPYLPPGPDGMLEYLTGWMVSWIAIVLIGNAVDAHIQGNPGGTSGPGMYFRGLLLRGFARLIWVGVLAAPAGAAFAIWRSGILQEIFK